MKYAPYIAGLMGLTLLVILGLRADLPAIVHTLNAGGWQLLWLIPYRSLYFLLYAVGWLVLLRPQQTTHQLRLSYLFWVTTVREAVDRLLPVASIGGGVVGIRLVRWRGLPAAPIAASVIVEIVLTLIVLYLFTAIGLYLLVEMGAAGRAYQRLLLAFLLTLPVPVVSALLLRYGSAFKHLQRFLRPLVGGNTMSEQAASLDRELRASMGRTRRLCLAGALQFAAFSSAAFEIWFALRCFGHPVGWGTALVLESMIQAVRHLAFVVPASIGVQEAGFVVFGHALGIGGDLALAVSMVKRMREVLCGVPALLSWQWQEGRRLRLPTSP